MTETADRLIQARFDAAAGPNDGGDWSDVLQRAGLLARARAQEFGVTSARRRRAVGRTRQRAILSAVAVAGALAAVMAATPAWALVRDALPFWNQPSAPSSVQVEFSSLDIGAPPGMSPDAVGGETRAVDQVTVGGRTRTLWVSPAKGGGFCFFWLPDLPGGCTTADQPLATVGESVPAHDPSQPAQTTDIPEDEAPTTFVSYWIGGDAIASSVSDVVIRFSDGSSVRPQITWVSAPINAGFFAYEVPNDKQSMTDHVTEIDAYDKNGALVKEEPQMFPSR